MIEAGYEPGGIVMMITAVESAATLGSDMLLGTTTVGTATLSDVVELDVIGSFASCAGSGGESVCRRVINVRPLPQRSHAPSYIHIPSHTSIYIQNTHILTRCIHPTRRARRRRIR
jgi:hypothetical protein